MTVTVQEMTNEILNCIKQYTEEASERIAEVCKEESETLKENLKKDSPKGKRMGNKKYSRGWKIKKTSRSGYVQYEVYDTSSGKRASKFCRHNKRQTKTGAYQRRKNACLSPYQAE